MRIRTILLFFLFVPTLSHAQVKQSNILTYIPPIIAATSNPAERTYSVATVRSHNPGHINVDHKFNSWGITQFGSERQQIMLKVFATLGEYDVPAQWALAIRTPPNPVGTVLAQDIEIKLMSNYTFNSELCCINTLPFSFFDQADVSYIGVNGSITFVDNYSGTFEVGFRLLEDLGDGMFSISGETTTVAGCWYIAGEGGISGCNL